MSQPSVACSSPNMAHALVLFQVLAWFVAACFAQSIPEDFIDGNESLASLPGAAAEFLVKADKFRTSELSDMTPEQMAEYDFIVVGAGSAGCAIASRLSENSNWTVLLIEAGGSEKFIMDIPYFIVPFEHSYIDWNYKTEPSDRYCLGATNKQCSWPRGKVMGGSSTFNLLGWVRPSKSTFSKMAEMGNTGWSWEEALPYFIKLEDMLIPGLREDKNYHGENGPLKISYPPYRTESIKTFMSAMQEEGLRTCDYNGEKNIGFSYLQTNTYEGQRWSSNRGYLHPNSKRPNLFLTKNSLVTKVLMRQKSAYGVEFMKGERTIEVRARKEVILCAGSIGSPQLLMLSGIGPKDHLSKIGIPVIQNAAVGRNMIDQAGYSGLVFTVNQTISVSFLDLINPSKPHLVDWVEKNGESPLSLPVNTEGLGLLNVDKLYETYGEPNMLFLVLSISLAASPLLGKAYGFDISTSNEMFGSVEGKQSWTMFPILLNPKSRGWMELRDKNINSHPRIVPNYFSDPGGHDMRTLIKGIRIATRLGQTKLMQKYGTQVHIAKIPGCENIEYDTNAYWECAARVLTTTIFQSVGTCKMGPEEDPTAVVNPQLQVYGVKNLRVGDASIVPIPPTGQMQSMTTMIAEKLSDMIKKHWRCST